MFKKMTGALAAVVIGIVMFCAAFPVLYSNEYWTVETEKGLLLAGKSVIEVKSDPIDPKDEGKLVAFSGKADTDAVLADEEFGVSANAVRLSRTAEIFQWVQEKEEGKDDEPPTYSYHTDWVDKPHDSSDYNQPLGHQNPQMQRVFGDREVQAEHVRVGAFALNTKLIDQIHETGDSPVVPKLKLEDLPADLAGKVALIEGGFYLPFSARGRSATGAAGAPAEGTPKNDAPQPPQQSPAPGKAESDVPSSPEVGDMRIRYTVVRPGLAVSVISGQSGDTLKSWPADKISINYLAMGTFSAQELIEKMQSESDTKTWIIRIVGVLMMFFGMLLILRPITALTEMVPFLGAIVGAGVFITAALASLALSLITIAVSWLFVRPIYGIPLLVAALVLIGLLFMLRRRQPQATTAPPLQ